MEVFFYGLFMDPNILKRNGVNASIPRQGYIDHYALKIGNRASLIPCKNERSYGIVMTVDKDEIRDLYSETSVADYIPEEVRVVTETGGVAAICYNLPSGALTGTNELYAKSLYDLAKKIGFPQEYLTKIEKMTTGS